jgi:hypothetical protein
MVWDTNQIKGYGNSFVILNMSCFFGVFSPGGKIDRDAFEQMQKAIHREGYDELGIHIDDSIAMGHLMLRVTTESVYDKQPLKSSCGRYLLVGHFRLDYRDELADKLGLTQKQLDVTPDSVLALHAYEKWNSKCVHHLEGDWAFVIYDQIFNKVFFFRDSCGYSLVFYSVFNSQVYFATDPSIYFNLHKFILGLDYEQLNKISFARGKIDNGKTLLSNVSVVESSSIVEISNLCTVKPSFYEVISKNKIKYRFLNDYSLEMKSLLSIAIKERIMSNKIGVFQSAGFDSSTISYFVSKEQLYRNLSFKTFTAFPKYLSEYNTEKQYKIREDDKVKKLVSRFSNCIPFFLNFENEDFVDQFNKRKTTNIINPIISVNSFWINGIFKKAKEEDVQILFAGKAGNYTYSWNAPFLGGSYFFSFKWLLFYRYCKIVSHSSSKSLFYVALKEIYFPVIKQLQVLFKKITNIHFGKLRKTSVLRDQKFNRVRENYFSFNSRFHPEFTGFMFPDNLRKYIYDSNVDQLGQRSFIDSQTNAIIVTDPFSDRKFVEFSFNIPEFLFNYNGNQKFISKKILSEIYNRSDLNFSSGIPQAYDIGIRLKNDFDLINFLNRYELKKDFTVYFDETLIFDSYAGISNKDTNVFDMIKSQDLLRALSIIAFYYNFHKQKT